MKRIFNIVLSGIFTYLAFSMTSCKEDYVERPITQKSQVMIAEYLASRADLSLFKEIADKAKKFRNYKDATGAWDTILNVPDSVGGYIRYGALLNSYGNYTVFVPDNDAVNEYLASINCTSVSQMDSIQLEEFMAAHLVQNQVTLRAYISGTMRIADSTTTGVRHYVDVPGYGEDLVIDKIAKVKNNAIPKETYNGYVYEISKVLIPHANYLEGYLKDAGKYTEPDRSRFTVMLNAFEEVGMTKSILRTVRTPHRDSVMRTKAAFESFFPTVLAVSDSAYAAKGITDVSSLVSFIKSTTDLASDTAWTNHYSTDKDLLKAYLLYHIVPGKKDLDRCPDYLDVSNLYYYGQSCYQFVEKTGAMPTALRDSFPGLVGYTIQTVKGNAKKPAPILNGSVKMLYNKSDIYCKNGYVHELDAPLEVKKNTSVVSTSIKVECEDLFFKYNGGFGKVSTMNTPNATFYSKETSVGAAGGAGPNTRYTTSKPNAGDYPIGRALSCSPTAQNSWFEYIVRDLPPSSTGKYLVRINYYRANSCASKVLVYWRNTQDAFDPLSQRLKNDPLNFQDVQKDNIVIGKTLDGTADSTYVIGTISKYREYNQNRYIGIVECKQLGDYAIRFLHSDARPGIYDNLIFIPYTNGESWDDSPVKLSDN